MSRKPPKYPTYNPDVDGNPFHWIIRTSAEIRQQTKLQVKVKPAPAAAGKK